MVTYYGEGGGERLQNGMGGGGGGTKREGGGMSEVLSLQKTKGVGREKVIAKLKGGGGRVFTRELEWLAILMGVGTKRFRPLKMGGGGRKA